jgi:uncharacterized protein (DUF433 family)
VKVSPTLQVHDRFRTGKVYTVAQAAKLADTSPRTIRNWLFGDRERMRPVLVERSREPDTVQRVSFLELADLVVVARYRRLQIDLEAVRDAHSFAQKEWGIPFPFASLNVTTLGGQVLRRYENAHPDAGQFVVMSSPGQYVLPGLVEEQVKNFDFDPDPEDPFVVRWHCYGRDVPIVVDPRFGGGLPTVEGRGITVDIILRRHRSGEGRRFIASDYGLRVSVVDEVLRHAA